MRYALPILALMAATCSAEHRGEAHMDSTSQSGARPTALAASETYDFERPDVTIALHEDLQEISGMTLLPDGRLGAVQDEDGIIFVIHRETGAIEDRRTFGDDGDYEGIERVGERIFVLRSNGTLIESSWSEGASQTRRIETPLAARNDTEGLAYDANTGRLLIACKEDPGEGFDDSHKTIYAYDPAADVFHSEPAYVIDADEIEGQISGNRRFKPSALAVHPSSGTLYVLSSNLKVLVLLSAEGGVRDVWPLPDRMFEQPEALAFLPDGTLYIASEGGEGPGMLYAFSPGIGD